MFKSSIAFLAACLITAGALAQDARRGNVLEIQPNAPDQYVVQKGDTLWGIASKFLKEPWKWPDVWRMNRDQIRNPHLIFPGDVVRFDRASGTLSLDRLSPRVRAEPLAAEAIPSIPPKVIEPFLSRPLVIERDGLNRAPRIAATQEGRYNLGQGGRAFAEGIGDSREVLWLIYRPGAPLVDPETSETLGFEAVYLGEAQLIKPGQPATLRIVSAQREVSVDDRLVAEAPRRVFNYIPRAPEKAIEGQVMSTYDGRSDAQSLLESRDRRRAGRDVNFGIQDETGPLSIVSLNRGTRHGVEPGHVLALYKHTLVRRDRSSGPWYMGAPREPDVQLPEERFGLVFVFRTFENVSYALVMQASLPVTPTDVIRTP